MPRMDSSAWKSIHAINHQLSSRGFFSQFVGSMIQYRHPKQPELSVGLSIEENPWRTAGKHGQFRYQLTNTTFVPVASVREEAQSLLNDLMQSGLKLHGDFDVAEFKGAIAADAMRAMQAASLSGLGMRDAFKTYLKAIHDALKESVTGQKQKTTVQTQKTKK